MMTKVIKATEDVTIGTGSINLILLQNGPKIATRKYNPREATKESLNDLRKQFQDRMGGLVKDQHEFAIIVGVHLSWLANAKAICNWKVGSDLIWIQWTPEAYKQIAHLFNGNHRFKLLQENVEEQVVQWKEVKERIHTFKELAKPSKAQQMQHQRDEVLLKELVEILEKEGRLPVKLVNMGEWIRWCDNLYVETDMMFTKMLLNSHHSSTLLNISCHQTFRRPANLTH
jgi:hypothetical protein